MTTSHHPLESKAASNNATTEKHRIEILIDTARDLFLKIDENEEHKSAPGIKVKKLTDFTKVCIIEHDNKKHIIFGVEKDQQQYVDIERFRHDIARELEIETKEFLGFFGDSFRFSVGGSAYAKGKTQDILESTNGIVVYGGSGRIEEEGTRLDINGCINQLATERPLLGKRILANIVDEHSISALKKGGWGCSISDNVTNFILVYNKAKTLNLVMIQFLIF